jgi:hypothetical protein
MGAFLCCKYFNKRCHGSTKQKAMKRTIFITMMWVAAICNSFAGTGNNNEVNNGKTVWYQMTVNKIEIENDIDLVLVHGLEKSMVIDGAGSQDVKWSIKNGVLNISSSKGSLKGKAKVTVTITNLFKALKIVGDSKVKSANYLLSPELDVFIDGNATVALTSAGKIDIRHDYMTELDVQKAINKVYVWE